MYYEIKKWNKVETGVYESDQKTFDWNTRSYCGLYKIVKKEVKAQLVTCTVWGLKRIDTDMDTQTTVETHVGWYNKLKDAKAKAEKEFGCTFKLDEVDIAG